MDVGRGSSGIAADAGGVAGDMVDLLVRQVTWEAEGVVSLQLVAVDGRELARWEPGAHIDVVLPSGLVRQYSLCGEVGDRRSYQVAVLRERASRGGSREIHESVLVGKQLRVRGPRNHFQLVDAPAYLFLAGGIGVTPILPMMREVHRRGGSWQLLYGGRSRRSMAFLDEVVAIGGGACELWPEDERGLPDLESIVRAAAPGTAVYCCGPAGMLEAVEACCAQHLRSGTLHIERFSGPVESTLPSPACDRPLEVELARSGVTVLVPEGRSILRAVLDVKPSVLYSCEEGYCGTCETTVLEGEPDHRDTVAAEPRDRAHTMLICVSRAKSRRLVLDL